MERKIYYYLDKINKMKKGVYIPPISCEIDPSNRCMLNCKFCMYKDYRKENNVDLDFTTYRRLIFELQCSGVKSITFTGGGEPLMNPEFNEMAQAAFDRWFEVGLITNGVNLDKVKNVAKFKFIRVSLDASNKEEYNNVKGADKFDKVIDNIKWAIKRGAVVGLSYVVCEENKNGIKEAQKLADKLQVRYIQFKPAWENNKSFCFEDEKENSKSIITKRYKANNNTPCMIAGLIGIIGADKNVYFCCQHRGDKRYLNLGSLKDNSFNSLWQKRKNIIPDISRCPQCRYMNYAKTYDNLMEEKSLFFDHKHFL